MKRIFNFLIKKKIPIQQPPTFVELLDSFLQKEIVENKLTKSTQYKYSQLSKNITNFLKSKDEYDIALADLKIRKIQDIVYYLHTNLKSCSRTHSARHIEMCKRVLDFAVREEYIAFNPLQAIETRRDPTKEVIQLDPHEITLMASWNYANIYLQRVADNYIFQCYTGLSYEGLIKFRLTVIKEVEWFTSFRGKNGNPYWIPVFPEAKRIYDKYNGILPRIANGTYNRMLKEIAPLVGIDKYLTTHTARKTFATLLHDAGYSNEGIKDMLGQKSTRTTETHYLRVNRNRISKEVSIYNPLPPAA